MILRYSVILILVFGSNPLMSQEKTITRYSEEDIGIEQLYIDANQKKILQKYDEAIELYNKILEKNELNASVHHDMARIYAAQGNFDQAIVSGKKAVRFAPSNKWFLLSLCSIYEQGEYYDEAASTLKKTVAITSNEDIYTRWAENLKLADKILEAIQVYDDADKRFGWDDIRSDEKVDLYLSLGKEKEALQEVKKWVQKYPDELHHLTKLARYYDFRGQSSKALKTFKQVLDNDPEHEEALTYVNLARNDKNGSELQQFIANPNISLDNKILTLVPLIEENDSEIMSLCRQMTILYPEEAKAYALYGDALWLANNSDDAISQYEQAIALNKSVFQVWDQLMMILAYSERFEKLEQIAIEAVDYYPNQAGPYYYQALAFLKTEQFEKALEINEEALFISEFSGGAGYRNAVLLHSQILNTFKGTQEAITFIETLDQSKKDEKVLEHQGDLYHALGDKASAIKYWKESLSKGGNSTRLQSKIDSI